MPFLEIYMFNKTCLSSIIKHHGSSILLKYLQLNRSILPKDNKNLHELELLTWKSLSAIFRDKQISVNFYKLENKSYIKQINLIRDQYFKDIQKSNEHLHNYLLLKGYLAAIRMLLVSSVDDMEEQCPEFASQIDKLLNYFAEKVN